MNPVGTSDRERVPGPPGDSVRALAPSPSATVHLRIERLVLEGLPFRGAQAARFEDGLRTGLMKRLSKNAIPPSGLSGAAVRSLPAGGFGLPPNVDSFLAGQMAADSLLDQILKKEPWTGRSPTPSSKPWMESA